MAGVDGVACLSLAFVVTGSGELAEVARELGHGGSGAWREGGRGCAVEGTLCLRCVLFNVEAGGEDDVTLDGEGGVAHFLGEVFVAHRLCGGAHLAACLVQP